MADALLGRCVNRCIWDCQILWPMGDARREPRLTDKAMLTQQHQNSEEPVAWNGGLGAVQQFLAAGALCLFAYAGGD